MARHSVTCDQLETSRIVYDGISLPVWRGVEPIGTEMEDDEPDEDEDEDEDDDDEEEEDDEDDDEADDATST